jgi:uncharacterized membrane protein
MSRKSQNRKRQVETELARIPEGSLGDLVRTTAPELAHRLDPRAIRLLGQQPITEVVQHSITATMWGGPLPPPDQLAEYNKAAPNAADRILAMAEKQAEHRQKLEAYAIPAQHMQSAKGQDFGFRIGIAGIAGATLCGIFGSAWAAIAIAGGSLGVLTVSFVLGKHSQSRQLKEKNTSARKMPSAPKPIEDVGAEEVN